MAELADIVINTKVTESSFKRLKAICVKNGFSLFDMLQMVLDCFIRFMDDSHNLDPSLVRIIRMFLDLPGWKTAMRLTDDMDDAQIMEAFFVLRHPNGTGAPRIVHVTRPMLDGDPEHWEGTYNIQEQLERFIELTNESLYKHLKIVSEELGSPSFIDTIHRIADAVVENPDEIELRLQFENNDWERGAKLYDQTIYKRPYTHGMDYIETQQTLFDKEEEV